MLLNKRLQQCHNATYINHPAKQTGKFINPNELLSCPSESTPPAQIENGIVECASAEELFRAVNFPVSYVETLPFDVAETNYMSQNIPHKMYLMDAKLNGQYVRP